MGQQVPTVDCSRSPLTCRGLTVVQEQAVKTCKITIWYARMILLLSRANAQFF